MKGVTNFFLTKEPVGTFWFLGAMACIVTCGWYMLSTTRTLRSQPKYFVFDAAGVWYVAPDLADETPTTLHETQTWLAMETIYNRGPEDLDSPTRKLNLFQGAALEAINDGLLKTSEQFREQQIHQKVEIFAVQVVPYSSGAWTTRATGQLIRTRMEAGAPVTEVEEVTAEFAWVFDPKRSVDRRFPIVCNRFNHKEKAVNTPALREEAETVPAAAEAPAAATK